MKERKTSITVNENLTQTQRIRNLRIILKTQFIFCEARRIKSAKYSILLRLLFMC